MSQKYLYDGYIKTLSEKFENALSEIRAEHNFELGNEFEIAICNFLRSVLPDNYGVCRGYVVDKEGKKAGDDIIIYEQARFPTLRFLKKDDFSKKEQIPIEAVYCYIEAKHTLHLNGEDGQSLQKAISQVAKVKELCSSRPKVPTSRIVPYHDLAGIQVTTPEYYPQYQNPLFSIILANQVKEKKNGNFFDYKNQIVVNFHEKKENFPDLIVLGKDAVLLPYIRYENQPGKAYLAPFFLPKYSDFAYRSSPEIAFGIALNSLMWALDWIQLGEISWKDIITTALGIPHFE